MAAGIQPSYAILTFKGKTWNIRYRGNDNPLLVRDPQTGNILGAVPTVDIIIVRSATPISKTFYLKDYAEGSFARPDCWSTNGVAPDASVTSKQNDDCPNCKWNAFGSSTRKIEGTDTIIKGKRCADNKRLAVVPAGDLANEAFGGPMLLRLPPTTFSGLSELEAQLHMQGYHYSGVVMRCSFDHEASHPKIIFTPIRVLNDHEAQEIVVLQDSPTVERILSEEVAEVRADPKQAAAPQAPIITPPLTVQQKTAEFGKTVTTAATTAFNPGTPPEVQQQELPPPVQMTAEQRRIAELEAKLAAMETKPARRAARRTQPVTPMGQQPAVQQAASSAGEPIVSDDEGDAPADLDSRIDALLKPNGGNT